MSDMFASYDEVNNNGNGSLETLNISNFNTFNAIDMDSIFKNTDNIQNIDKSIY